MAFSAVQSHPLLGPLCIPGTPQSLERGKGSLGVKLCFPSRPEIQIIQGVQDRHFQGLAAAGNAPGKMGRFYSQHVSHGDRGAGQAGGSQHSPSPEQPWGQLRELEDGNTVMSLGPGWPGESEIVT